MGNQEKSLEAKACPSTLEWKEKYDICTVEYNSAIKKDKFELFVEK